MFNKRNVFLIFAFMVVPLCSCLQAVDYRINLQLSACTPRNCTQSGPLCETCSSLVGCIEEDGTWIKTPLATCNTNQYCVNGACTVDYDPYCAGVTDSSFPCNDLGVFPDPFYKNRFIFCVRYSSTSLKDYPNECGAGLIFNIKNDLCDISGETQGCPGPDYPVPLCTTAGQTGPISDKPAMYYICKERTFTSGKTYLYPYLYLCPGGEVYVNYVCSSNPTPTTTPPTIPTTTPPTTPIPPS